MKFTLAMVLMVFASRGAGAARGQPPPPAEATQPSGAEAFSQQPTTSPPPTPQPCAAEKDTCTVSEPAKQEPASAPAVAKAQDHESGKVAAKATRSTKAKARRRNAVREQAVAHDESTTKKTIVRKGSTSDPTILTLGATSETGYSRQTTEDLLAATDANLKQARSRSLNRNQVETVAQIKLFVEQANAAMKEGELDRGHNLALKANLLSDDLVKH